MFKSGLTKVKRVLAVLALAATLSVGTATLLPAPPAMALFKSDKSVGR